LEPLARALHARVPDARRVDRYYLPIALGCVSRLDGWPAFSTAGTTFMTMKARLVAVASDLHALQGWTVKDGRPTCET